MNSFNQFLASLDLSTRGKRRKTIAFVIDLLEKIRLAEEGYMERMPLNLQDSDAYAAADFSVESISDAVLGLSDAY
ncbi:MAG: hypothetical protein LBI04_11595 [Treponema sp.]|jgi:hypothetical protein|nr:hypothetical protein [Treponema sp.]